mmetsp:Transcript_9710/g.23915  ORF Transcript_9710/g.23915 Transcript_9710/m.23915 type:complete len:310 (-) Transcript_9710:1178-2107(-)|eukprot:CAMPEP_0178995460 /NCGR_PEP_ID=MMETSP0795-20121207/7839_1 /TAXON_ID=88552 /ORGANISM="Amoebophrya sp., Strain Ameob2" /LENGTH=309 /DNA_ID=CAMNT_0020687769 /DNA_START=334 /DNA_END=1263 /DNA_ORIENTATION=+
MADAAKQKDSPTVAFLKDFAIGGTAGGISKTLAAPIERVKLLIQTQDANPRIRSGEVPRYTGIGNCFTRVYAEQGMLSFWRGNGANVMRYIPQQAFNLSFKDTIKRLFPKYSAKTDFAMFFAVNLASAGIAAAGSLSICYPLDFARTRLASDVGSGKKTFEGIGDCIRKTIANQGVMGLYNGFGASVAGVVVYRGLQMGFMDSIMGLNPWQKDRGILGLATCFAAAQVAGIVARPFNYPFDTVRRRLQMESEKPMAERMYKGTLHCATTIVKTEGITGLYKGLVADIVRGAGSALVLVAYDRIKLLLDL